MSIALVSKNGKPNKDIREYFVDFDKDIKELPTNINKKDGYICTGCSAYVVHTGNVYLYSDETDEWIKQ